MVEVTEGGFIPEVEIARVHLLERDLFMMKEKLGYLFSEEERIKGEERELSALIIEKREEKETKERRLRERGLVMGKSNTKSQPSEKQKRRELWRWSGS